MVTASGQERAHYIDWLRVVAILLVFVVHVAHIFDDATGWVIKNKETSFVFTAFMGAVFFWIMPLFFLAAGGSSFYALRVRTPGQYARGRIMRLLIPCLFGVLVIVPPQHYFHCLNTSEECLSFLGTWSRDLYSVRLRFHPSFISPGSYLWFLAHLLVMSLLALPLFLRLTVESGRRWADSLLSLGRAGLLLLAVPLIVVRVGLTPLLPGYAGWADFFFWYLFFIYGYWFIQNPGLVDAASRHWKLTLGVGAAAYLAILALQTTTDLKRCFEHPDYSLECMLFLCLWAAVSWSLVLCFFGLARTHLNFRNRVLAYAAPMVLPFYVLHHLVVVVIGFQVVTLEMGMMSKFVLVGVASLLASMVLCEVTRQVPLLRGLMGMRWR